jgi:hypothetical protein
VLNVCSLSDNSSFNPLYSTSADLRHQILWHQENNGFWKNFWISDFGRPRSTPAEITKGNSPQRQRTRSSEEILIGPRPPLPPWLLRTGRSNGATDLHNPHRRAAVLCSRVFDSRLPFHGARRPYRDSAGKPAFKVQIEPSISKRRAPNHNSNSFSRPNFASSAPLW